METQSAEQDEVMQMPVPEPEEKSLLEARAEEDHRESKYSLYEGRRIEWSSARIVVESNVYRFQKAAPDSGSREHAQRMVELVGELAEIGIALLIRALEPGRCGHGGRRGEMAVDRIWELACDAVRGVNATLAAGEASAATELAAAYSRSLPAIEYWNATVALVLAEDESDWYERDEHLRTLRVAYRSTWNFVIGLLPKGLRESAGYYIDLFDLIESNHVDGQVWT